MRAAFLRDGADTPAVEMTSTAAPAVDEVVGDVLAAAINPVDLLIAAGRHASLHPSRPYTPGFEGVARLSIDGAPRRAWWIAGVGAWAEHAALDPTAAVDVPDGLDDDVAAAIGIAGIGAWLALTERAGLQTGQRVLIVGASGAVGRFAIQMARLIGAECVVAAARSTGDELIHLGADAVVDPSAPEFLDELRRIEPRGFDLVLDLLFGRPGEAAIEATADEGTVVLMSQLAGTTILLSPTVLQRRLSILGFRNSTTSMAMRRRAYASVAEHVIAGALSVEREVFGLDDIGDAWRLQAGSPHRKLVVVP